jgi:hypothetical protein
VDKAIHRQYVAFFWVLYCARKIDDVVSQGSNQSAVKETARVSMHFCYWQAYLNVIFELA